MRAFADYRRFGDWAPIDDWRPAEHAADKGTFAIKTECQISLTPAKAAGNSALPLMLKCADYASMPAGVMLIQAMRCCADTPFRFISCSNADGLLAPLSRRAFKRALRFGQPYAACYLSAYFAASTLYNSDGPMMRYWPPFTEKAFFGRSIIRALAYFGATRMPPFTLPLRYDGP